MKRLKKVFSYIATFLLCLLFLLVTLMQYLPEQVSHVIGFRSYVVLSDSMEPTIPTFSLVFVKTLDQQSEIPPNTIITFETIRDNKKVLITHYYRKQQIGDDKQLYYRTQPEGIKDQYDSFETKRSDIIGTYLFHIPNIGKFFLFLKSDFSIIFYFEILVILLVNLSIKAMWKDKLDANTKIKKAKRSVHVLAAKLSHNTFDNQYIVEGKLRNTFILPKRDICVNVALFNKQGKVIYFGHHIMVSQKYLHFRTMRHFSIEIKTNEEVDHFEIAVSKYRI